MTTAARATSVIPACVLDDYARTSHAGDVLGGGHRHTVPIGRAGPIRGGHARRHRVYDLGLLGMDVYRCSLLVPILNGLGVRSVHVAVATGRDSDWGGSRVLDSSRTIKEQDQRIKRSAFRGQLKGEMRW